ncbi:hypothetical protein D3C72_1675240 [compost metagenome]
MLATCFGAKSGASSITTRPAGMSRYRVLSGSSGRQSDGFEALITSAKVALAGSSAGALIWTGAAWAVSCARPSTVAMVRPLSGCRYMFSPGRRGLRRAESVYRNGNISS